MDLKNVANGKQASLLTSIINIPIQSNYALVLQTQAVEFLIHKKESFTTVEQLYGRAVLTNGK